jgi:hypothetical protein
MHGVCSKAENYSKIPAISPFESGNAEKSPLQPPPTEENAANFAEFPQPVRSLSRFSQAAYAKDTKVFWFFFSKKNRFPGLASLT